MRVFTKASCVLILWLLFSIIYVLSFATVWSATTGYISGSVPTFNVAGITYTSTKSPELTVCWVLEDDRVTLNGTKRIIIGPPAGDAFGYHPSNLRNPLWSQGNLQPTRNQLPKEMNDFMDVLVVRSRPELITFRILTVRERLIRDLNSYDQRNSIVS